MTRRKEKDDPSKQEVESMRQKLLTGKLDWVTLQGTFTAASACIARFLFLQQRKENNAAKRANKKKIDQN